MARVVGLESSSGPGFKSCSALELIPGGVDSACHPSEVSKMSASFLVSCVRVATRPGLCPIAKKTAEAAPTLCTEDGPNGLMDAYVPSFTPALMYLNCYLCLYTFTDTCFKAPSLVSLLMYTSCLTYFTCCVYYTVLLAVFMLIAKAICLLCF